jgi:hypothetical protein
MTDVELTWLPLNGQTCHVCGHPLEALQGSVPPVIGDQPIPVVDETRCSDPRCPTRGPQYRGAGSA